MPVETIATEDAVYELIETEQGTHVNIYGADGLWQRKVFITMGEYATSDTELLDNIHEQLVANGDDMAISLDAKLKQAAEAYDLALGEIRDHARMHRPKA